MDVFNEKDLKVEINLPKVDAAVSVILKNFPQTGNVIDFVNQTIEVFDNLSYADANLREVGRQASQNKRANEFNGDTKLRDEAINDLVRSKMAGSISNFWTSEYPQEEPLDYLPNSHVVLSELIKIGKEKFSDYDWSKIHDDIMGPLMSQSDYDRRNDFKEESNKYYKPFRPEDYKL